MIPFFKKVFNDLDFRHFGGFFPQNLTASVLSCYELLTSCKNHGVLGYTRIVMEYCDNYGVKE